MHEIGIESSLLEHIRQGNKTVEGRLGKPRFLKMQPGDLLRVREDVWKDGKTVQSIPDQIVIGIDQVLYFESFQEMFESIEFSSVLPDAKDVEDALAMYRQFYSAEEEEEYGVVALMLEEL